ncbi:hypothetical protein V8C86DRAFT_2506283, partial [Haematococcus lacustris]
MSEIVAALKRAASKCLARARNAAPLADQDGPDFNQDDAPEPPAPEPPAERRRPSCFLPWQQRRVRVDEAAHVNAPQRKRDYLHFTERHQQLLGDFQKAEQNVLQSAVNAGWCLHSCAVHATNLKDSPMELLTSSDEVEYVGTQSRFTLKLPCWQCTECGEQCKPNPLAFFCWPSSQVYASIWYDIRVLRSYALLLGSGLSMEGGYMHCLHRKLLFVSIAALMVVLAGYLDALNAVHYPLTLHPPQPIKSSSFSDVFFDYRRATDRLLFLGNLLDQCPELQSQLPHGVFSDCPICAFIPGACQDGYVHAICGDACTKPSSYAGVAKASRGIQQHTDSYMDRAGLEGFVQDMDSRQQLSLNGAFAEAAATAQAEGMGGAATSAAGARVADDNEGHGCSASLSCARPGTSSTTAGQPCAVRGIVGFVCCHGVPLLGMYCNMRTAEQFVYYLIALALLLQQCSSMLYLMHVYIDFACQLKITWARYAAVLHLDTERMRLMVNWMHGASHNMACQLKNNGRYLEGSAHRVGEQTEQHWSQLKPMSPLLRYMTSANRVDALQAQLSDIAFDKQGCMVAQLKSKNDDMVKKLGALRVSIAALRERAVADDVEEAAAHDAFKDSYLHPKASSTETDAWKAVWFGLQLLLKALEAMASGQTHAPSPARLPSIPLSADLAQLLTRGGRGPHQQRLDAAKARCMKHELEHGLDVLECFKRHGEAAGESSLIARGLLLYKDCELARCV